MNSLIVAVLLGFIKHKDPAGDAWGARLDSGSHAEAFQ